MTSQTYRKGDRECTIKEAVKETKLSQSKKEKYEYL
jgi:hypothetical protein